MFFEIHLLGVLCSCQPLGTKHNLGLKYLVNVCKFGKLICLMLPNLHSGCFLIEEAVILEQSWREGKSNVELWVPLENATTITDPPVGTSSKISSYQNKSPPTRNTHHACDHRQAGTQQRHPWSTLCEVELFLSMMYLYLYFY